MTASRPATGCVRGSKCRPRQAIDPTLELSSLELKGSSVTADFKPAQDAHAVGDESLTPSVVSGCKKTDERIC